MQVDNFISKPNTVKLSNIKAKYFSLMPSEHRTVFIQNKNFDLLSAYCKNENVGEQIEVSEYLSFNTGHYLGTISCMNNILYDETKGENISPLIYKKANRKLSKGHFIISRNASLGKIAYLNNDKKIILNGGISYFQFKKEFEFYVPAFFITNYGTGYLTCITSGGGTQQNAKRGTLLSVPIPKPTLRNHSNPDEIIQYVSLIVQNIINKEEEVQKKQTKINSTIDEELINNQLSKYKHKATTINEIKNNAVRFDTGMYSNEYKHHRNLINNYKNGFFNISLENLKSGSTPDIRIFSKKALLKWVTPTDIKDEGFFTPTENISMPSSNNLDKSAILFINRTSKGKKGEYVGIACYYDHSYYGDGHHNQGIYKVEDYSATKKQFIVAFTNATIMRKICGYTSQGTKMKEMKMNNFSELIFPSFPDKKQNEIAIEYYNALPTNSTLTLSNYLTKESSRNSKLGIFQLNLEILSLKEKLALVIDKIIKEEPIRIEL